MDMSITAEVIAEIAMQLGLAEDHDVEPASSFEEDLGLDELDRLEILMMLEDVFDVEIADEEWEKVTTVQGAVQLVEAKKAAAP